MSKQKKTCDYILVCENEANLIGQLGFLICIFCFRHVSENEAVGFLIIIFKRELNSVISSRCKRIKKELYLNTICIKLTRDTPNIRRKYLDIVQPEAIVIPLAYNSSF